MCSRFDEFCSPLEPAECGDWTSPARRHHRGRAVCFQRATWRSPIILVPGSPHEDSVLVATREADVDEHPQPISNHSADDGTLEPISQIAEHTPELADQASAEAETANDEQFSGALAHAAEPRKLAAQPAKFNGIQPGKSTKSRRARRVEGTEAKRKRRAAARALIYKIEPFRSVEVQIERRLGRGDQDRAAGQPAAEAVGQAVVARHARRGGRDRRGRRDAGTGVSGAGRAVPVRPAVGRRRRDDQPVATWR